MSIEKEKQGLSTKDYETKLKNKTNAIRIGNEVPEGDVNLAYLHTQEVHSDENIALIDTTYFTDNVIPQDQRQSLAVANEKGELEYINTIDNNEFQVRPPGNVFPTDKVNITRLFKKDEISTESALYYKFVLYYHYDNQVAKPNDKGEYEFEKYTGNQIELTDENGNLLDDQYKYEIYVKAHPLNPKIYTVVIYTNFKTNQLQTFKVRYNHIDEVVVDDDIQAVKNEIELYTGKHNTVEVNGITKQMLENGKLRILNNTGAYKKAEEDIVRQASLDDEIYAVKENAYGDGYHILVPQTKETDPRTSSILDYHIYAEYQNNQGETVKVSAGHFTDWIMNEDALLDHERKEFTGEWKNIGLRYDHAILNAREMVEMGIPFGTHSFPRNAKLFIEDNQGNIITQINPNLGNIPEAKINNPITQQWKNAMTPNALLKDHPMTHTCTIFPERQRTKWTFSWKLDGSGYTEKKTVYTAGWQVCADVEVRWIDYSSAENYGKEVVDRPTVRTEYKEISFRDHYKRKLSNYRAVDILNPMVKRYVEENYPSHATYKVTRYYGRSNGDINVTIDEREGFIYGQTNNSMAGGVIRTPWSTKDNGLTIQGKGVVEYYPDGHYLIATDPAVISNDVVPSNVLNFKWDQPILVDGDFVSISMDNNRRIQVRAEVPSIEQIGTPYTLKESEILKEDGIKHLEYLFDTEDEEGFYKKLNIPSDIPKHEILLRIERGNQFGSQINQKVNYRFRCINEEGFVRLPVDQFQDQLGVNRLRLDSILNKDGDFDPSIQVDVVAWTTYQNLESTPVYAVKIDEEKKVEIEKPRVEPSKMAIENWYMRVKNGRFLKRIQLPYFEIGSPEKTPEIYKTYPMLLGMVKSPDDVVEVDLDYRIPEYMNQNYKDFPVIEIKQEEPLVLDEYQIQTRYAPIVTELENYHDFQIQSTTNFPRVYSIRGNEIRNLRIADIDSAKGMIYLLDRIREQDQVFIDYSYYENWYTYRGFYYGKEDNVPVAKPYPVKIGFDVTLNMSVEYEKDTEPPVIQLVVNLPMIPDINKYNFRDVEDGLLPVLLEITDNYSGVKKWKIVHEDWQQEMTYNEKYILSTEKMPINIPIQLPDPDPITEKIENKADIIFVLDVSGSMKEYIKQIEENLNPFVSSLNEKNINWRIGITTYSDINSGELILKRPFRTKETVDELYNDIAELQISRGENQWGRKYGGDTPESVLDGILDENQGARSYDFRDDAVVYFVVLTDAPGHTIRDQGKSAYDHSDLQNYLVENNITLTVITNPQSEYFYKTHVSTSGGVLLDINGLYGEHLSTIIQEIENIIGYVYPDKFYTIHVEAEDHNGNQSTKSFTIDFTDLQ